LNIGENKMPNIDDDINQSIEVYYWVRSVSFSH